MLVLVLEYHPEDVPPPEEPSILVDRVACERREDLSPHASHVLDALARARKRQPVPHRPGVVECIVHTTQAFTVRSFVRELLDQPHLLEVSDVPEVPEDRTHDGIVLHGDLVVV